MYVYGSLQISVTKVPAPTLITLQGGGGVQFPEKKHYVTLEWLQRNEVQMKLITSICFMKYYSWLQESKLIITLLT